MIGTKIKRKVINVKNRFLVSRMFPEIGIQPAYEDMAHLTATMKWLRLAQKQSGCGGVSAYYNLLKKEWGAPYRETTGYIIPTFVNYSKISGNKDFEKYALEMGEWELSEQLPDGSFSEESKYRNRKKIFNTGQIILGLCFLYDHTRDSKFLVAAQKAGEWLMSNQENDGCWEKFTTKGARTYHSRVAWSLLETSKRTNDNKLKSAASKNIEWVLKRQNEQEWFEQCSLSDPGKPWTHLIAYTIRGLLESSQLLESDRIFKSAYKAATKMLDYYIENQNSKFNFLPGTFDEHWQSRDEYTCLTGDAQMAIIWLKIYNLTKEDRFLEGAEELIDQIKKTQIIKSSCLEINGGIAGSFPIDGDYASFIMPNWAAKFFSDSLMLKMDKKIKIPA